MKQKKIPLRKCVSCGESRPKKDLIRIVKNKEGEISIDLKGKASGRGAYVCSTIECLENAKKSKKIARALETNIPNEIYDNLILEIQKNG